MFIGMPIDTDPYSISAWTCSTILTMLAVIPSVTQHTFVSLASSKHFFLVHVLYSCQISGHKLMEQCLANLVSHCAHGHSLIVVLSRTDAATNRQNSV